MYLMMTCLSFLAHGSIEIDLTPAGVTQAGTLRIWKTPHGFLLCDRQGQSLVLVSKEGQLIGRHSDVDGPNGLMRPTFMGATENEILIANWDRRVVSFDAGLEPSGLEYPALPWRITSGRYIGEGRFLVKKRLTDHLLSVVNLGDDWKAQSVSLASNLEGEFEPTSGSLTALYGMSKVSTHHGRSFVYVARISVEERSYGIEVLDQSSFQPGAESDDSHQAKALYLESSLAEAIEYRRNVLGYIKSVCWTGSRYYVDFSSRDPGNPRDFILWRDVYSEDGLHLTSLKDVSPLFPVENSDEIFELGQSGQSMVLTQLMDD